MIKVWHDDIRRPPDPTWWWVRTNGGAQAILSTGMVEAISLDHDLGLHEADPDAPDAIAQMGDSPNGNGYDLVCWMIDRSLVPDRVTIHSWNPVGAQNIAARLNRHGYNCTIAPYVP